MRVTSSVRLEASVRVVTEFVATLDAYTEWMPIVHKANLRGDATWDVELRAKVGPLARSKRLTMTRTACEASGDGRGFRAVFERCEPAGRRHAPWVLTVTLNSSDGSVQSSELDMELFYGGSLWTGGLLEKVLSDAIDTGKQNLADLVRGR